MPENVIPTPRESLHSLRKQTPPWGYFDLKSHEYVLTTPFTPRPWKNILWNDHYNAQPTQVSGGVSYRRFDDGEIELLNWAGGKYLYLYNLSTDECFCPTYSPVANKDFDTYEHRISLNSSRTTMEQHGLRVRVIHSVDPKLPQEYFEVELENLRSSQQAWRLVFYTDIDLGTGSSKFSSLSNYAAKQIQNNGGAKTTSAAFLETTVTFGGSAFDRSDFTGVYGSLVRPESLFEGWPEKHSPIDSPILTGFTDFSMKAGESSSSVITLGLVDHSIEEFNNRSYVTMDQVRNSRSSNLQKIRKTYDCLEVKTPDDTFDLYVNTWIKHQLNYCAHWNRGWGKGFRDSNQDAWAYTLLDSERSRKMILDCLPYQYPDGRTVRKWAPIDRDAYNDGGVWLIFSTHAYLAESGDFKILDHVAPFFESEKSASLYEHLCRGVEYLWKSRGDKGLCLMPLGDWNDRLTGIGCQGKGQSVWTTLALVESCRCMKNIAARTERISDSEMFESREKALIAILRKEAWNGQWYSRAFTDSGEPVGAPENPEGSIYLIAQAWSILAGVATEEQVRALIQVVKEKLQTPHGFRLLTPPYQSYNPSIGLLSATQPGMLENGGNYCHGSMFMAYALGHAGERRESLDALKRILPVNPENPPSISRQEPYSLTNSYCSPESGDRSGRSYFPWRTGTAGWAFRCAIESIMGVKATLDGLEIKGEPPRPEWENTYLKRTIRGKVLHIHWVKTGSPSRILNGQAVDASPIQADDLLSDNTLEITF